MNYVRLNISVLFIFLITLIEVPAQNYAFKHLNTRDGLSENHIMCIFQDSKGFLWFGTQDGLNRYDGYNFKIFRHQPGNLNSIADYAVNAICEDDSGNLWIGTREGITIYNPGSELYTHLKNNPADTNSLSNNFIKTLYKSEDGNIWIGTGGGLNIYNPLNRIITRHLHNPDDPASITSNNITAFSEDKDYIFIGTSHGLNLFNKNTLTIKRYAPDSILNNALILSIVEHSDGYLWLGTNKGVFKIGIHNANNLFFEIDIKDSKGETISVARNVLIDQTGYVWLATSKGLVRYNPQTDDYIVFSYDEYYIFSLNNNQVTDLFLDRSGVLWIGTIDGGLNTLNLNGGMFYTYRKKLNNKNTLSSPAVTSIMEDNGVLWLGTKSSWITLVTKNSEGNEKFELFDFDKHTNSRYVTSIKKDNKNNIWVTTFGAGIFVFNRSGKIISKINRESVKELTTDFIHTTLQDDEGNIWIATGTGGVVKFDPLTGINTPYRNIPDSPNSLSADEVVTLIQDTDGFIWLGTSTGGLNRFNKDTEEFKHFKHNNSKESLSSNRILSLFEDSKKRIWVGTFGGGLNLFNRTDNTFKHFGEVEGIPGQIIFSIIEDLKGDIWLSTNKGLIRFDTEINNIKIYDRNDGIQGDEFIQNSSFFNSETGTVYFGGTEGISFFNPDNIKGISYLPPVIITEFKLFNEPVNFRDNKRAGIMRGNISYTDQINLSFDDNVLSFEFASLDFSNPGKNKYSYMLEGFDKDWVNAGNKNFAVYTNLNPGSYTFKVKGTNSDGIWNDIPAVVKINIAPPIWRRWWAFLIYAFIALGIFLYIRKYELNRLELKNEIERTNFEAQKLQEVDKMKSRFFANISHEFRTPLTIILGLLSKRMKLTHDRTEIHDFSIIKRNASKLLQLINQLLEISKIEAGSERLLVSKQDVVKFLRRTLASFSSYAYQKNIKLMFNGVSASEQASWNEIELYFDKEKLETIMYNLLSNAFKFTPSEENIFVDVRQRESFVEISVLNTGVGISPDKLPFIFQRFYQIEDSNTREFEGTGIGLALVKDLVELHKGEISAESKGNEYVRFVIKLPSGRKHLQDNQIVQNTIEDSISESFLPEDSPPKLLNSDIRSKKIDSTIVLIIEDNSDLRAFISEQLLPEYSVLEAENGNKGIEIATEIIPDIIISDIMMPGMDGYALCKEIKENERTSHIPVILLTARAASDDKLLGLETGADDYLIKPFNPEELKLRVKNLISSRKQLREKFRTEMILKPTEIVVPSNQKVFIEKLRTIIDENLQDDKFGVEALCKNIGMSRAQLHRKIKALTNKTTTELIREFRLERAAGLIKQNAGNMAEIAYRVGFSSQAYFTKSFQEVFHCSPSEYKKNQQLQQ